MISGKYLMAGSIISFEGHVGFVISAGAHESLISVKGKKYTARHSTFDPVKLKHRPLGSEVSCLITDDSYYFIVEKRNKAKPTVHKVNYVHEAQFFQKALGVEEDYSRYQYLPLVVLVNQEEQLIPKVDVDVERGIVTLTVNLEDINESYRPI